MDLMSKQSLLDFSLEILCQYSEQMGYKIVDVNNGLDIYPNAIAESNGKMYGIMVRADEVRKQPKITTKERFDMMRFYRLTKMIPVYASIGFGARNAERFDKGILLENDPEGYYCNFTGLEEINIDDIPEKDSDNYVEYVLHTLGTCCETKNIKSFEQFISNDVKLSSINSARDCNSKNEVVDYFNQKLDEFKNCEIKYELIRFKGDWYTIKTKSLQLSDGKVIDNARVHLPQPDGKLGLIVQVISKDKKDGYGFIVKFNDDNLVNDIHITDPYSLNFEVFEEDK